MPRRVELSAEELELLLGPGRFAPTEDPPPESDLVTAQVMPETELPSDAPAGAPPAADATQPPDGSPRPIGDADLVQAILGDGPNFEQLALRAIRERTGEDLARIVDGSTADAATAKVGSTLTFPMRSTGRP